MVALVDETVAVAMAVEREGNSGGGGGWRGGDGGSGEFATLST